MKKKLIACLLLSMSLQGGILANAAPAPGTTTPPTGNAAGQTQQDDTAQYKYKLTLESDGRGTVSYKPNRNEKPNINGNVVMFNGNATINIVPNTGYEVDKIFVDGTDSTSMLDAYSNKFVLFGRKQDTTVKVTFKAKGEQVAKYKINLTTNDAKLGTVACKQTVNGQTTSASENVVVNNGDNATIVVTPATGAKLSKLLVNGTDVTAQLVNNEYTLNTVRQDMNVDATFVATVKPLTPVKPNTPANPGTQNKVPQTGVASTGLISGAFAVALAGLRKRLKK